MTEPSQAAAVSVSQKIENPAPKANNSLREQETKLVKIKAQPMTAAQRAKLYALFVVKCLPPREVAAQLGVNPKCVSQYIFNHKLTAVRDSRIKKAELKAAQIANNEVDAALDRWAQSSEMLADDTLSAAQDELAGNSPFKAKNLASYSLAAKNFVGIYKDARGVGNNNAATNVNILGNFYIGAIPDVKPEPRNVTPPKQ